MLNIYIYIYIYIYICENATDSFVLNSFFCFPFPRYYIVRYVIFNYYYKFSGLIIMALEIRFAFSRGLFVERLHAVGKFSLLVKQAYGHL